jgi:uncharacterized membrane protein
MAIRPSTPRQRRTLRLAWLGAHELRELAGTRAGRALVVAVGAIALLTIVGLVALAPRGTHQQGAPPATPTVAARAVSVTETSCGPKQTCRSLVIEVDGRRWPMSLGTDRTAPDVGVGDRIRVYRPPGVDANTHAQPYEFVSVDRRASLLWLGGLAALLAVVLLRWRGALSLLGVGLSLLVLVRFVVPAILDGRPAVLVALVAALAVMFITLVLTNGIGAQTLAAALGIAVTLGVTCVLAVVAVDLVHLDGRGDELAATLGGRATNLSLQGIVLAAMLIGALGVLADTAVTQASAVMALRRTDPELGARRLYSSALTVGRDHLSATIHTLVLAYAGTTLSLLLVLKSGPMSTTDILDNQAIAEPIVASIVGAMALMLAVPITTGLAAATIARVPPGALPHGHGHSHSHG